jgi:hypothetical protein
MRYGSGADRHPFRPALLRGLDRNQRPLGYETGGPCRLFLWCRFVPSCSGFVPPSSEKNKRGSLLSKVTV